MARCAVCLVHMVNGDKYTLVEEFVVHRRCLGGTIVIREKAATAEREAARHAAKLAERTTLLDAERRISSELREQLNTASARRMDLLVELEGAHAAIAQRDIELAQERNLRALAELEVRSTRSQPPPPQAPAATKQEEISSEPIDITSARFSLLELD